MNKLICLAMSMIMFVGCTPETSADTASTSSTSGSPANARDPNVIVMDAGKIAYDQGDYDTAFAEWSKLANEGDGRAMNRLAVSIYGKGHGVPQDDAMALDWLKRAIEAGEPIAEYNLGLWHLKGRIVEADTDKALYWIKSSAEQDYAYAQAVLAQMYSNGEIEPDYEAAVRWARRSADHGSAFGQRVLGDLYTDGLGVKQDAAEGIRWYRMAADQGDASSQAALGGALAVAAGQKALSAAEHSLAAAQQGMAELPDYSEILSDYSEAKRYLQLAVDQGNEVAEQMLAVVNESIARTEDAFYLGLDDLVSAVDTYKKNQARFKRDYVGRAFRAKMPVYKISENAFMDGHWTIVLGDGVFGTKDVKCKTSNPADVNVIADWNKGDIISVTGLVADVMMGDVELSNCSLIYGESS